MASQPVDCLDPHVYTSGRWLRNDKLERDSRHISFDFESLCKRVIALCAGAVSIATYDKREGGFNRVFIFTTNNEKRVVARLPFALAGPSMLTTSSEVATIKYLQSNTSIPIPKILDWSDDASNSIGSEYIIMEHSTGVQLAQRWPTMTGDQQIRCIETVYQKVKEMVDIKFSSYGSLYFGDSSLGSGSQQKLNQGFSIGPHWKDLTAYCDGLIDTGISRVPPTDSLLPTRPCYHGTVEEHLNLLESGRTLIKQISEDPRIRNAATPTLFHPDLHKRNIFVSNDDPTTITAIIDWQSAAIEPAFWYADEIPDFAKPIPHPSLDDQLEPNSEQCAKAYGICTRFFVPTLVGSRLMDEALFRPFRYCYRTWRDGAIAFRHELIETAHRWKELRLAGSCPYHTPTPKELVVHQKEYQRFVAAQELRSSLSSLLNIASDGWAPPEDWKTVEESHKELFDGMLKAVLSNEAPCDDEPIRNEEDLREIWPFDLEHVK